MGCGQIPDTTESSSQDEGYFVFVTRGKGFGNRTLPSKPAESDALFCANQAKQWRDELLKAYGYKTIRVYEEEKKLYIKAGFINNIPKESNAAKRALKLLVCDQSTLFKDDDSLYQSKRINSSNLSSRKKLVRDYNKRRDKYIDMALHGYSSNPPSSARILLTAIVEEAVNRNISISKWLYSKKHLKECKENSPCDEKSICNTENLDIDRCREDCKQLLSKREKNPKIIEEFDFERFIVLAVNSYICTEKELKINIPEASSYRDESKDCDTVPGFQQRLDCLEALEEKFNAEVDPVEALYRMDCWDMLNQKADEQTEQYVSSVRRKILWFLRTMGVAVGGSKSDNSSNGHVSNESVPTFAALDKEADVQNGKLTSGKSKRM